MQTARQHTTDDGPKPACCGGHHHDHGTVPATDAKPGQFICPMCPGVVSDEPGDCPKCGMPLEQILPLAFGATVYTCPMHPEIEQDHPGD